MLDATLRRLIDPPLDRLGRRVAALGCPPEAITLAGFALGILAVPALALQLYPAALALILLNRFADGLDGAVARSRGPTDLGGLLDIVCDFIFYAAIPFGFALARPENALPAAFLILSFMGTGATFLAYAAIAARRGLVSAARGPKSLYYLGGLTEGTETVLAFLAFCLFPGSFPALAYAFGGLCWLTTVFRLGAAVRDFRG